MGLSRGKRRYRGVGQLSTAEKRMLVAQGTHRWCKGPRGCGGRGKSRDGLPHAPCRGDGLIKVKNPGGSRRRPKGRSWWTPNRKRRRRGRRGRRAAGWAIGGGTLWAVADGTLGALGTALVVVLCGLIVGMRVMVEANRRWAR